MKKTVIVVVFLLMAMHLDLLVPNQNTRVDQVEVAPYNANSGSIGGRRGATDSFTTAFFDDFESGLSKWEKKDGVSVESEGSGPVMPPSASNASNLDGGGDTLTSKAIDLSAYGYGFFEYNYQWAGMADPPESGDDLTIEMNLTYGWTCVQVERNENYVQGQNNMWFVLMNQTLPAAAFHANFKIRFKTGSTGSNQDNWFVDDVKLLVKPGVNHFFEDFPAQPRDANKWPASEGSPKVNSSAQNIPSGSYALNLDGSGDTLVSRTIDLSRFDEGYVYYFFQQGDGSNAQRDEPEDGDNFIIEYFNQGDQWIEFVREQGEPAGIDKFTLTRSHSPWVLFPDAFHDGFKIRLRTNRGEADQDDWFIDNLGICTSHYYSVVFNDNFEGGSVDQVAWNNTTGTPQINQDGEDEPSPPTALNLDGDGDMVESKALDLSVAQWASFSYWRQKGGDGHGDAPEAGDDLKVEIYLNPEWKTLKTHKGSASRNKHFTMEEFPISGLALHGRFKIRFSTPNGDGAGKDDWYVDNVRVVKGQLSNPEAIEENFETGGINRGNWAVLSGTPEVNKDAHNEPSKNNSLNLNGKTDMIATNGMDMSQASSAMLLFRWQQGNGQGEADEPDKGDDLFGDILMPGGWLNIFHAKGEVSGTQNFESFTFVLPKNALHNNFKVRFRVIADEDGKDDWFIDNITLFPIMEPPTVRIAVYTEYTETGEEGLNPLKALNAHYTDYELYLFDDHRALAGNLSYMDILVIPEQTTLSEGGFGTVRDSLKQPLRSFFERGGKTVVCDGGEGHGYEIVAPFLKATRYQTAFGTIDVALPKHSLSQELPATFPSATSTACFTDVNGRGLATITIDNEPRPVVVEKRSSMGSVILLGFDFTGWNSAMERLMSNIINWNIVNDIEVSSPEIDEGTVFAGKGPYTFTADVLDTIGPEDVSSVSIEFVGTNISVKYETNSSQPEITGAENDSVVLDSWYVERKVEHFIVHFNLTFDWNFPEDGTVDVDARATSSNLGDVRNSSAALFSFKNKLEFVGDLVAKNEEGNFVEAGEAVRGNSTLTFTGVKVAYFGGEDTYPLNDEFDVVLGSENGGSWVDPDSSGRNISIVSTVPQNATSRFNFTLSLSGDASEFIWPRSLSFNVGIDNSPPVLDNPLPRENKWRRSSLVNCSIEMNDTGAARVEVTDVELQYSTDDGATWSDWTGADGISEEGVVWKEVHFEQGKNNKVRWRAFDSVGNGPAESDELTIWVDSQPVLFENFTPTTLQRSRSPLCTIEVSDATSGVNPNDIWVRYAIGNESAWSNWEKPRYTEMEGGYRLSFNTTFQEGVNNSVQWSSKDFAGNNNLSEVYNVEVEIPPPLVQPKVRLTGPMNNSRSNLRPTLEWELVNADELDLLNNTMRYHLYLQNSSDVDTVNDTARLATLNQTSHTLENDLSNDTTYYWTVVPTVRRPGEAKDGICLSGEFALTAIEGFVPIWDFNISITPERASAKYHAGDRVDLNVSVQNIGNNPDFYQVALVDIWNNSYQETAEVLAGNSRDFDIMIVLPENMTTGNHTINFTVSSLERGTTKNMSLNITIVPFGESVNGGDDDADEEDMNDTSERSFLRSNWKWIAVGAGVFVIVLLVIIVIRRRREWEYEYEDEYEDEYWDGEEDEEFEEEDDELFDRIRKDEVPEGGTVEKDEGESFEFCGSCGEKKKEGARFCPHCGAKKGGAGEMGGGSQEEKTAAEEARGAGGKPPGIGTLEELMSRATQVIGKKEEEAEAPKEKEVEMEELPSPTGEPKAECPACGGKARHIQQYDRYYCNSCKKYLPEDFQPGREELAALPPPDAVGTVPVPTKTETAAVPKKPRKLDDITSVNQLLDTVLVDEEDENIPEVMSSAAVTDDDIASLPEASVSSLSPDDMDLPPPDSTSRRGGGRGNDAADMAKSMTEVMEGIYKGIDIGEEDMEITEDGDAEPLPPEPPAD